MAAHQRIIDGLLWTSMAACAAVAAWGFAVQPERPLRWLLIVLLVPGLMTLVELGQAGDRGAERATILGWHRVVFTLLGLWLSSSVGGRLAVESGLLADSSLPTIRRLSGVFMGLGLAAWGNYLPKLLSPWRLGEEPFAWQKVHRFCGWLATLVGIGVVAAWLVLPIEAANRTSGRLVFGFVVLGLGRKLLSVLMHSPREPDASHDKLPTTPR